MAGSPQLPDPMAMGRVATVCTDPWKLWSYALAIKILVSLIPGPRLPLNFLVPKRIPHEQMIFRHYNMEAG
jgi:hypothetical protein